MDEAYPIEVLHIVNPHVMFIESLGQKGVPVIEQVGIYGVLPVSITIDIDGEVVAERCENWPVGANTILREFLAENKDCLYFVPVHVEERSTIFDENLYKFGDIIAISVEKTSITDHFVKLAAAIKDESYFCNKLATGRLKIKLNSTRTEEVVNAIKKYYQKQKKVKHDWQKTIDNQISLHCESKKITAQLTEKNLKLFDSNFVDMKNVIIEQKERDLNLCRDADMVSVGCGSRRKRSSRPHSAIPVKEPFIIEENNEFKPHDILKDVKKYLEVNGQTKHVSSYNSFSQKSKKETQQSTPKENREINKNAFKVKNDDIEQIHSNKNERKIPELHSYHPLLNPSNDAKDPVERLHEYTSQDEKDGNKFEMPDENFKQKNEDANKNYILEHKCDKKKLETERNSRRSGHHMSGKNSTQVIDDSQHDRVTALQHQSKTKKTPPQAKVRRYAFCPDMEMSPDNLKTLVPITVVEEYNTNNLTPPQIKRAVKKVEKSALEEDDCGDSNVEIEIIKHDKLKTANTPDYEPKQKKNYDKHSRDSNKIYSLKSSSESKSSGLEQIRDNNRLVSSILRRKLQELKESQKRQTKYSSSNSDTSVKDTSSSTEQSKIEPEQNKVELEQLKTELVQPKLALNVHRPERNVNPFKNLDGSKSVFVDKLVTPILMVHTKNDNLILPQCDLRDIPFKTDIHCILKNMRVQKPKRLQSVTWSYILRGHSIFMISPAGNGKTLGYVPAVCNLITDSISGVEGVGPICVIVCATSLSVSEVETYCKRFLGLDQKIIICFPGLDSTKVTTALLNGCHVLICTAPMLVRFLEADFGVDLRRLLVLVFDDCERLSEVYTSELSKILHHVKNMLKNRADKSLKVQYVVASRQWCDFMTPLAKKTPDTIIAIGACQECVLYSKTKTSVNYVKSQANKINAVVDFMKEIDTSKPTVIVCRSDDEVDLLENTLTSLKYTVFACNSTMTLHDLYKLSEAWGSYQEPLIGPILVCCDGNLTHLNITNANYLVHFSMPALFSMFCKRFSVLNENYASIFEPESENVKIKIFLDETNVEQLPKILHFVKRCTKEEFPILDNIMHEVLREKDWKKAEILTPICNNLLMLGECMDVWNCQDRHTVFKEFDEPKEWMPKQGMVTFKIMHYDSAVTYSARLLTKTTKSGSTKYPNNYNTLSLKMGRYFSKEANRRLHGTPKIGDICAVAIQQNFFERCKVMKIIPSSSRKSNHVLIKLIDEEQLTLTTDVNLHHLPADLKDIETYVVKIRLANIQPKDKDVTFSMAAKDYLQKYTNRDSDRDNPLYVRGRIVMTLGNSIFVDSAESCADLSSFGETIVKRDLKMDLLSRHAEPFPQHIEKLQKLCGITCPVEECEREVASKVQKRPKWAHLEKDDFSTVYYSAAVDAGTFFVRQAKFQKIVNLLHQDIQKYVNKVLELPQEEIYVGNTVLAEFPDDKTYERARIDAVVDSKKVKCFFVDNGDWREVLLAKLRPITDNIMHRIPFQAIECRLIGVKPPGDADYWPEFSTGWLYDNCFEDADGNPKYLFVKYFTKEEATVTGGHKYGVLLFDTNSDSDVVINKIMVELNLAKENVDESKYIDEPLNIKPVKVTDSSSDEESMLVTDNSNTKKAKTAVKDLVPVKSQKLHENGESSDAARNMVFGKPIRSCPLVNDSDSDSSDKWDVNVDKDLLGMFGQPSSSKPNVTEYKYKPENTTDEIKNNSSENLNVTENFGTGDGTDNASYNKSKEDSSNNSCVTKNVHKNENDISELTSTSPMLETQSDSDDIDIEKERIAALNIFRNKIFTNEVEKSLKKPELVKVEIKLKNDTAKSPFLNDTQTSEAVEKSNKNVTLDSDDLSSVVSEQQKPEAGKTTLTKFIEVLDPPRKPKLVWRQSKNAIIFKINVIGVEDYVLEIQEKHIRFRTWHNDTAYEFDFELYGVIKPEKSVHSNKGQYILVNLVKVLQRNWLNLSRDFTPKKWIVYDIDAIDFSSDEDEDQDVEALKVIRHNHDNMDTASEDEDFADDMNFSYKKHLDH